MPARRSARAQGVGFVQLGVGIVVHGFSRLEQPFLRGAIQLHRRAESDGELGEDGPSGMWGALRSHPGVSAPKGFDPTTFSIQPFPRNGIRFLADGDVLDLGNRRFRAPGGPRRGQ